VSDFVSGDFEIFTNKNPEQGPHTFRAIPNSGVGL